MKNNLSCQISLSRVSPRLYQTDDVLELSRISRMEKVPTTIYENARQGASHLAQQIAQKIRKSQAEGEKFVLSVVTGRTMTDVFADGLSSRLIQRLVKESRTCTDANAYITGSFDPGAVIFSAQVADGVKPETAIGQIWDEIHEMQDSGPTDYEINKARNRQEAAQIIGETASQTMSQTLATYEMLGDANLVNTEYRAYDDMQPDDVMDFARRTCTVENSSTLIYRSK